MILFALVMAGLGFSLFSYQLVGTRSDGKRFPARGRHIEAGSRQLHVVEQGSGTSTVLLEAGLAASSLSWAYVQPLVAAFARTVAYDRAGLGESDARPLCSLDAMLKDLSSVLDATSTTPPIVLVGHSFGGLIVRAFAHRYPERVAGLVLVDPVSIDTWAHCSDHDRKRIRLGATLSRRGARLASFGVVRFAIAAAALPNKRITSTIARASAGKATPMLGRLAGEIQKLPAELIPLVRAQWSRSKPFRAMADHLECLPAAASEAARMAPAAHIPIIILSAESATSEEIAERDRWIVGCPNGRHEIVPDTGHWLHLERPDTVAKAVRDVVAMDRSVRHRVDDVVDPDTKTER